MEGEKSAATNYAENAVRYSGLDEKEAGGAGA